MEDLREIKADKVVIEKKGGFSTLLRGLFWGGLIGAGVALLTTPRTGDQTRELLRERGYQVRERAKEVVDDTRMKAEELTRRGAERTSEIVERGQTLLSAQKTKLESVVEGIQEGVRTYQEEGSEPSDILPYESEANPATNPLPPSDMDDPDRIAGY